MERLIELFGRQGEIEHMRGDGDVRLCDSVRHSGGTARGVYEMPVSDAQCGAVGDELEQMADGRWPAQLPILGVDHGRRSASAVGDDVRPEEHTAAAVEAVVPLLSCAAQAIWLQKLGQRGVGNPGGSTGWLPTPSAR